MASACATTGSPGLGGDAGAGGGTTGGPFDVRSAGFSGNGGWGWGGGGSGGGGGTIRAGGAAGRWYADRCGAWVGGLGAGRGGGPTRGSGCERTGSEGGATLSSGTSTPSSSASRLTNQRASEPRSTSGSSGRAAQSFTVASMPAARRDASMNP